MTAEISKFNHCPYSTLTKNREHWSVWRYLIFSIPSGIW